MTRAGKFQEYDHSEEERSFFKDKYNGLKESVEVMLGRDGECNAQDLSGQPEEIDLGNIEDVPIAMFVG